MMIKKILFIFSFAFLFMGNIDAQRVSINEDYVITQMMERFTYLNKSTPTIQGWRIQLLATTDRQKMEKAKEKFLRDYPGIFVDWTHSRPYYKLRAGAFKTKLEAERVLRIVKKDFPSAYPAKDATIQPRELVGL